MPCPRLLHLCLLLPGLLASGHAAGERVHPAYEPSIPLMEPLPPGALHVSALQEWARPDFHRVPEPGMRQSGLSLNGWRGERVSGLLAAWSEGSLMQLTARCDGLEDATGNRLQATVSMVRYTMADGGLAADIIGSENRCDMPGGGTRPMRVEINIPADAAPGAYHGSIRIQADGCPEQRIPVELTIDPETLPPPSQWQVHLDLWQHPQAVARWHDVEPWSPEHLALLKPLMQRLADAGQKAITCSLIDEAWNGQTYDSFPGMVAWVRGRDGAMRYDYRAFDTWVRFMEEDIGIRGQISCYTMIPWSMRIRYFDEASNSYRHLELDPGQPSFAAIWGHFLDDFRAHLQSRGWLEKTCIALDERPDSLLRAAKEVLDRHAPELRIVSAVNAPSSATEDVYDLSPILTHAGSISPALLTKRQAAGQKTTFYVCMHPLRPNTYTASPRAEAEWLGLFAAANNLDGFLRWAYNSWNGNPFENTDYNAANNWSSGDCFLVYPGNLSSLRFESLRDGIEDFEKINLLRAKATRQQTDRAQQALQQLNEGLSLLFTVPRSQGNAHAEDVLNARALIRETAKQLTND